MTSVGEVITAIFAPQDTSTLQAGADDWIGTCFDWQTGWLIDDSEYVGQWAWIPLAMGVPSLPAATSPVQDGGPPASCAPVPAQIPRPATGKGSGTTLPSVLGDSFPKDGLRRPRVAAEAPDRA